MLRYLHHNIVHHRHPSRPPLMLMPMSVPMTLPPGSVAGASGCVGRRSMGGAVVGVGVGVGYKRRVEV